jgi:hypothetical protein
MHYPRQLLQASLRDSKVSLIPEGAPTLPGVKCLLHPYTPACVLRSHTVLSSEVVTVKEPVGRNGKRVRLKSMEWMKLT